MQSLSRMAVRASRSIPRSTSLKIVGVASSQTQSITRAFLHSPQPISVALNQRRLYNDDVSVPTQTGSAQLPFNDSYKASDTLYIGNLFFDTTPDQLKAFFSAFGTVTEVKIPTDIRGFVRGYGFVTFSSIEETDRARAEANGKQFNGRRIVVNFAGSRPGVEKAEKAKSKEATSTLFVGNLAYTMTDKDLNDLFRPLRKICDVRVAIDRRTGQPRGFAHADFLDVASAVAARKILEGKVVQGRELKTDYAVSRERPAPRMTLQELIAEEQQKQEVSVDHQTISQAEEEGISTESVETAAFDAEAVREEKAHAA